MLLCVFSVFCFFCEIVLHIKTSDTRAAPFLIQRRKFYLLQNCKVNTKIYGKRVNNNNNNRIESIHWLAFVSERVSSSRKISLQISRLDQLELIIS